MAKTAFSSHQNILFYLMFLSMQVLDLKDMFLAATRPTLS